MDPHYLYIVVFCTLVIAVLLTSTTLFDGEHVSTLNGMGWTLQVLGRIDGGAADREMD